MHFYFNYSERAPKYYASRGYEFENAYFTKLNENLEILKNKKTEAVKIEIFEAYASLGQCPKVQVEEFVYSECSHLLVPESLILKSAMN